MPRRWPAWGAGSGAPPPAGFAGPRGCTECGGPPPKRPRTRAESRSPSSPLTTSRVSRSMLQPTVEPPESSSPSNTDASGRTGPSSTFAPPDGGCRRRIPVTNGSSALSRTSPGSKRPKRWSPDGRPSSRRFCRDLRMESCSSSTAAWSSRTGRWRRCRATGGRRSSELRRSHSFRAKTVSERPLVSAIFFVGLRIPSPPSTWRFVRMVSAYPWRSTRPPRNSRDGPPS